MVPLGSVVQVKRCRTDPTGCATTAIPRPTSSTVAGTRRELGQAEAAIERLAQEVLPNGIGYEWTDLSYQQRLSGNTELFIFPLCVLLAFLVLAAQYESWSLPLAVILIVPMSLLCAITGVWLTKGDNNIFTQIGFLVLIGLACKNAILIVEFARELHMQGRSPWRRPSRRAGSGLQPILMTSFAFIMGVLQAWSSRAAPAPRCGTRWVWRYSRACSASRSLASS